ncbi:MAG: redoxin domain-containing protein [Gammaproteobacteria bacterium]|nr:redoxin domain-containing protein [Gammaproteobacteria bacterium]
MNRVSSSVFLLLLILSISGCKISPVDPDTLNVDKSYSDFTGVSVETGNKAPDFSLPNSNNKNISLKDFKNKKAIMLLFYRGEWCAYCVDQLDNYQALLPELKKYNIQLIAISPDKISILKNTQRQFGQGYIFLSDEDLKVTRRYGIGNAKNLPHPALFLISKEGILKWYYASKDHEVRPTAEQVEKIIHKLFSKE